MTHNSSNSSKQSGNSKQIAPAKHWCFTLNNPSKEEFEEIWNIDSAIVPRYVFQLEEGELKTPHLQGYMYFAKKARPKGVFSTNRIHWEKAKYVRASIRYCQKEEGRLDGPWYRGIDPIYKIKIPTWKPWMTEIKNVIDKEPDFRKIYWFWDRKGNIGKTLFSKWIFTEYDRVVIVSGRATDMKNCIIQYEDKNFHLPKIVLINVPRSKEGFVSWSGIEEIKDMMFYSGKYEGGMVCGANPHVIIMANYPPELNMLSIDRWHIREITE